MGKDPSMEPLLRLCRRRSFRVFSAAAVFYLLFLGFEFPFLSNVAGDGDPASRGYLRRAVQQLDSEEEILEKDAPVRPDKVSFRVSPFMPPSSSVRRAGPRRRSAMEVSGLVFGGAGGERVGNISELHKVAGEAWKVGAELFGELRSGRLAASLAAAAEEKNRTDEACPHSIALSGAQFRERGRLLVLPCGLTLVDGLVKCEKWFRDDDDHSEESKTTWWLNRLIGRTKKVSVDWPYPFVEDKLFVLTLSAGLEGYHVHVDGRHITSFPYRTGFVLEDATGLSLNGNLDVESVFAASLPATHPSFAPQRQLDMSSIWQAPPLPDGPVEMFIGILSAGNHFAERMAVRKSWMQSISKSQNVVARFFVAMHARKEINIELKKEAEFFGDIVIVPFMDSYDLVVLKTVAICEYGVRRVSAKYIMKCDDDTFVRLDSVLNEVRKVPSDKRLYVGNINYYHKPLRYGKWAVTYEEWPEEDYPPYANGPGYIISSDIAQFIVSDFERHTLRLFKMEDVSMGMWVEQFNTTKPVEYIHSFRFCQFGCIDDYLTAHYQSPRQMICMWDKLRIGKPQCCNMR
ncbi:hypothetical protein Taro_042910 [Colocasia esculenta]|uniref:Galectin domain-containing protein n=1 Tax=Colocasia esculenta TaxID=4460 RepID=A0A843WI34_COLES|nr:hypothetical protein [Colocasia esculenta]